MTAVAGSRKPMTIWRLLTGPEDIGQTPWFWLGFAVFIAFLAWYPAAMTSFEATNMAFYLLNIPLAFGLCLLWGYCGVLSFGQVAFVGIAGYTYGIIAGNMAGNPLGPIAGMAGGLGACAAVAAVFGYFMFYGRVQIGAFILGLVEKKAIGVLPERWRVGRRPTVRPEAEDRDRLSAGRAEHRFDPDSNRARLCDGERAGRGRAGPGKACRYRLRGRVPGGLTARKVK